MSDDYIITYRNRAARQFNEYCRQRSGHGGLASIARRPETLGEHIGRMRAEYPNEEV